ncbi:MAG: RDD family protein [Theionarchaea archaeon]|nr:RDD family protein [Theionarchaea archaeon]
MAFIQHVMIANNFRKLRAEFKDWLIIMGMSAMLTFFLTAIFIVICMIIFKSWKNFLNEYSGTILFLLVGWFYFARWESSKDQATPGKKIEGIRVTDLDGKRISFSRATLRYFTKMIWLLICLFGSFFMDFVDIPGSGKIVVGISLSILLVEALTIGLTEKKQGLHDLAAETVVIIENHRQENEIVCLECLEKKKDQIRWSRKIDKQSVLGVILVCAAVLICVLVSIYVLVSMINDMQEKEAAVVEYEMGIESVCLKAIDMWRQSGIEIDQYRTTNDARKFFSYEHKLEGRDELRLVTFDGGYRVAENVEAIIYIISTYQIVGTYSGGPTGAGEVPAAVITWEVFFVDLRNQVITAHAVFVGPFPLDSVDPLRTHWENETVIGIPPIDDLENWIASLPIPPSSWLSL